MDKRSQTLEALSAYIATQSALLAQTQADITRLDTLRCKQLIEPKPDLAILEELNISPLSTIIDAKSLSHIQGAIDWSLFSPKDPAPLRALALAPLPHAAPPPPAPPGALQLLVRSAKASMLDPVFSALSLSYDPPPPSPLSTSRPAKPAKPAFGPARRRAPIVVPADAFVRRDMEDESAEVDIGFSDAGSGHTSMPPTPLTPLIPLRSDTNGDATMLPPTSGPTALSLSGTRVRKPSRKAAAAAGAPPPRAKRGRVSSGKQRTASPDDVEAPRCTPVPVPVAANPAGAAAATSPAKANGVASAGRAARPKSETYKQAWSVEEQHLLERLLEEYPDGAKNRWQQISRAMGGRRTPRQVASRVQKYFEKLKRFGLDAEGAYTNGEG